MLLVEWQTYYTIIINQRLYDCCIIRRVSLKNLMQFCVKHVLKMKKDTNYLHSETSHVPGPDVGSRYDNVLLGQGYRTPHGAVINEYGAMGGMMISRGKPKK
jgi:hypothetical protein